jgi:hypothetical protein
MYGFHVTYWGGTQIFWGLFGGTQLKKGWEPLVYMKQPETKGDLTLQEYQKHSTSDSDSFLISL